MLAPSRSVSFRYCSRLVHLDEDLTVATGAERSPVAGEDNGPAAVVGGDLLPNGGQAGVEHRISGVQ